MIAKPLTVFAFPRLPAIRLHVCRICKRPFLTTNNQQVYCASKCFERNARGMNNTEIISPECASMACVARRESNARLIAAAPELLQIAKDLCEELRLIRMKDTNAVYDPTVRIRAEIAITKAEGR